MEASSLVSKARTAFHSAAAKAESLFTDTKKSDSLANQGNVEIDSIGEDYDEQSRKVSDSDSTSNAGELKGHREVKYLTKKPAPLKTKQDWQERLKNIKIGKKGVEDFEKAGNSTMSFAIFDENLYLMSMRDGSESKGSEIGGSSPECLSKNDIIPPASVMKQLAVAIEAGKKFKSMKELLASSRDTSPVRQRAFSAVKSLVLRGKEEKFTAEFGGDEKILAEGQFPARKIGLSSDTPTNMAYLPKDIHGAPPQSFVVKLSEVIGSFRTLRQMALFWYKVVAEIRRLWSEGQYVPGIPPDEIPQLNLCIFYQKLQVINSCISRKQRRSIATESLESVIRQSSSGIEDSAVSEGNASVTPVLYARVSTGDLVLRLGADSEYESLTLLETGEPVYSPVMQEGPLLTEDLIKETEELVLRTGRSVI
ncbi:hypothetical protein U1Q18_000428 [Sarracenia purpurea var. burkii]